jgi:START domain
MTSEERPRKLRRILKKTALAVLGLFITYKLVAFGWTQSGSNEWKLASEENGITIWTRKVPGDSLLRVKAEMRARARVSSVLAILEETEVLDKSIGIDKVNVLERKDTPLVYMAYHHYVHNMPQPVGAREFILQTYYAQDPKTYQVELNVLAAPNKRPPVAGLVRVKHLNNIWAITPLPNGELDLTMTADVDLGGNLPFFANNAIMPFAIRELFKSIRNLSATDRYRKATMPRILEPGEAEGKNVPESARDAVARASQRGVR